MTCFSVLPPLVLERHVLSFLSTYDCLNCSELCQSFYKLLHQSTTFLENPTAISGNTKHLQDILRTWKNVYNVTFTPDDLYSNDDEATRPQESIYNFTSDRNQQQQPLLGFNHHLLVQHHHPSKRLSESLVPLLSSLHTLDLSGVHHLQLPESGVGNVKHIILSGCIGLVSLLPLRNSCSRIDLSYCHDLSNDTILELLGTNSSTIIKSLDLSYCHNVTSVVLSAMQHIIDLQLNFCNGITDIDGLESSSLKFLGLRSNNFVTRIGGKFFLEELVVSGCKHLIEISKCCEVKSLIANNTPSLQNLGKIDHLHSLSLRHCKSSVVFTNLSTSLTSLDISSSSNCISDDVIKSILDRICSLRELKMTGITTVYNLSSHHNHLTSLDISSCKNISTIPKSMMKSLTTLNISCCTKMKDFHFTNLTHLNAARTNVMTNESVVHVLQQRQLVSLNISLCRNVTSVIVPETSYCRILKMFRCENLTSIDIVRKMKSVNASSCPLLTSVNISRVKNLDLSFNPQLVSYDSIRNVDESLNISGTKASLTCISSIIKRLTTMTTSLSHLEMSYCQSQGVLRIFNLKSLVIKSCSNITTVYSSNKNCKIDKSDCKDHLIIVITDDDYSE